MPERDMVDRNHRIAMLIDGDNAQPVLLEKMLIEASKYGTVIIRRIYGDWTDTTLNGWKKVLLKHAFQPIQQFRYTVGKNATDSALIIEAMDLLHQGITDCFCLVSSDSDYTRLATRIRESGYFVIGIGKNETPHPFVVACDVFIYTENLIDQPKQPKINPQTKTPKSDEAENGSSSPTRDPLPLLMQACEITMQENGLTMLATLGNALHQIDPGFDPRSYGFKRLSALLRAYSEHFEIDESLTYVRLLHT